MGILGILGIVFLVLKLAGIGAIAGWSWWLVLLPFYAIPALWLIILLVGLLLVQ